MSQKIAVFPGTFDPITNGHVDLIERAANLFPTIIVAVAENKQKSPAFSVSERTDMVQSVLSHLPNVKILPFDNLLADFVRDMKANVIIRGLRAVSDFEYELQLANMNRRLDATIETMFLTPAEQFSFISSSLVKEIAALGGKVESFVPAKVVKALQAKLRQA